MARNLPVPISQRGREIMADPPFPPATLARVAISAAPDVARLAERLLLQRARRGQTRSADQTPAETTHIHEIEIDVAMPFVRKVVVRNATTWSTTPAAPPTADVSGNRRPWGLLRVGLLGVGGVAAVAAGMAARRVASRESLDPNVIDVDGATRS
jgi:hypothetical protein